EVLAPADEENHIDKWKMDVPVVCGARNLSEAARRIGEGAAMIRTKGEAGTGNVVEAVRHMRRINSEIRELTNTPDDEVMSFAKELSAPRDILRVIADEGRLPVVNFAAGGIATPADAALMMQLGADGVFVGSGIFKAQEPEPRGRAIVDAVTYYDDPKTLAKISEDLGEPMVGINMEDMSDEDFIQTR
ncbi:MAG: pyridoxal 5'-phosphate synthase lyase subunit PdxS, partial [Candidatus Bipolaricaulota bacterium]